MGNKIIITAGGTSERIDNVRKITNSSTGKLGCAIANEILDKMDNIDTIYYVTTKDAIKPIHDKVIIKEIFDTNDLKDVITTLLNNEHIDYFIHAMAVSDYTVDYVTTAEDLVDSIKDKDDMLDIICNKMKGLNEKKISSNLDNVIIKLKKTPKIIKLIKDISPYTYLVGFKLLDDVTKEELIDVAYGLKEKNKCNLVIANDLSNIRKGLHKAYLIKDKDNYIEANGKEDIACKLVEEMINNDKM